MTCYVTQATTTPTTTFSVPGARDASPSPSRFTSAASRDALLKGGGIQHPLRANSMAVPPMSSSASAAAAAGIRGGGSGGGDSPHSGTGSPVAQGGDSKR